jgi:4-amino-4-deoxy-L-arabinose transferase
MAQHPNPFWYFIPVTLGGALPGTALIPAAVMGMRRELLRDSLIRFALCWLLFPLIFFSASRGKLATYVLPCFPPLALLISVGLGEYYAQGRRKTFTVAITILASLLAIAGIVLVIWQVRGFTWAPYRKGEEWKWIFASLAAVLSAALALHATRRQEMLDRVLVFCAVTVLPMFVSHFALPGFVAERNGPGDLLTKNALRVNPLEPVLGYRRSIHAICWYLKRADVYVMDKPGELITGLGFPDAKERYIDSEHFKQFIARFPPTTLVTVVMNRDHYLDRKDWFPVPVVHETNGTYEFLQFRAGKTWEEN